MMALTNEQLAEIRERAEDTSFEKAYVKGDPWKGYEVRDNGNGITVAETSSGADAEFIAHAREDVPKLLAEIERLKNVARDILEAYDSSERRVIDEVSTNRKFALAMHEYYITGCENEINGVDEDGANL